MPIRPVRAAAARRALAAAVLAAAALPGSAGAWATLPLDPDAAPAPIAVAGDASGGAFAVYTRSSGDAPLLFAERSGAEPSSPGVPVFAWQAPIPMPGGIPQFTTESGSVDSVAAAGGGEGAGAIAVHSRSGAGNLVTLLVRDAARPFGAPQTVGDTRLGRLGAPVLGLSQAGTAVLAFTAERGGARRVVAVTRLAGHRIGRTRPVSLAGAGTPAVAVGPQQLGLAAWVRRGTLEVSRFDADGRPRAAARVARAAGSAVAAGGSLAGAVVAWRGADGAVRAVRRRASGALGRPQRVAAAPAGVRSLVAALDERGVATLAWLDGRGSGTRLRVAILPRSGAPKVTSPARGAALGPPALIARPGGGAILAWAAAGGWFSARTDAKGALGDPSQVSRTPPTWRRRPFLLAGPANRVAVVWLDPSPGTPGAMTLTESTETDLAP